MSPPRTEFFRSAVRWLWPAALLALIPKCVLCLFAYAGLGAALGLSGPEICGAPSSNTMSLWMAALAASGLFLSVVGLIGFYAHQRHRRPNNSIWYEPGR